VTQSPNAGLIGRLVQRVPVLLALPPPRFTVARPTSPLSAVVAVVTVTLDDGGGRLSGLDRLAGGRRDRRALSASRIVNVGWLEEPNDLLAGPRGRRLCFELLPDSAGVLGWPMPVTSQLPSGLRADLEAAVAAAVPSLATEGRSFAGLMEAVNWAMYWQEPDETDRVLEHPLVQEILEPIAQAVAEDPESAWWVSPVALEEAQYVQWLDDPERPPPPIMSGARERLNAWRSATVIDEGRERPADPTAPFTGSWWSTPAHASIVTTTRALPNLGAVGLALVEDSMGVMSARCWPLAAPPTSRVFEITCPDDWVALVSNYPLDVTESRRHDWWRVTGWADSWLIPDWADVAADFDAVHLTVAGYLTTAGRIVRVAGEATLLAGWSPDETFWLNDVLREAGPTTRWRAEGGPTGWVAVLER